MKRSRLICDDVVVVSQVGLGQFEHRFGLQRLDELRAQIEEQIALQVLVLRSGDLRAFLGALQAQFALVLPLMQVADAGDKLIAGQRHPVRPQAGNGVRSDLKSVAGEADAGVGTQKSGDLRRLHLVHAEGVGLERRVGGLKPGLHLLPGKTRRHRCGCLGRCLLWRNGKQSRYRQSRP